jgi:hypothetical protein
MRINDIILQEKLLEIDDDVDRIYDFFFKEVIENIQDMNIRKANLLIEQFSSGTFSLSGLIKNGVVQSNDLKHVNELEPVKIYVFDSSRGNAYIPATGTNPARIFLNINSDAYDIVVRYAHRYDSIESLAKDIISDDRVGEFINEFKSHKVKASIHHELAHYYDDIMHNRHITKTLSQGTFTKKTLQGDPFETHIEIEAQIHNIKQLKKEFSDIWDELTFEEMLSKNASLSQPFKRLSYEAKEHWKKRIRKRMAREGLLGDNMKGA